MVQHTIMHTMCNQVGQKPKHISYELTTTYFTDGILIMIDDINELKLSDFIQRVTEMYLYNLKHYSEENPTIDGAFREVLLQTAQELTDNE